MAILNSEEQKFLESVVRVSHANPFSAERIEYEAEALGNDFDQSEADWNLLGDDPETQQVNTRKIAERAYAIIARMQPQLKNGQNINHKELQLYEDTVLFLLYY